MVPVEAYVVNNSRTMGRRPSLRKCKELSRYLLSWVASDQPERSNARAPRFALDRSIVT